MDNIIREGWRFSRRVENDRYHRTSKIPLYRADSAIYIEIEKRCDISLCQTHFNASSANLAVVHSVNGLVGRLLTAELQDGKPSGSARHVLHHFTVVRVEAWESFFKLFFCRLPRNIPNVYAGGAQEIDFAISVHSYVNSAIVQNNGVQRYDRRRS